MALTLTIIIFITFIILAYYIGRNQNSRRIDAPLSYHLDCIMDGTFIILITFILTISSIGLFIVVWAGIHFAINGFPNELIN